MMLRTIHQANVREKKILIRVDFNVPLKNGRITDDTRIIETIPTLELLLKKGAKQLVIMTHMGRPKGQYVEELKTDVLAKRLAKLMHKTVAKVDILHKETIPEDVEIVILENLRFNKEEKENDKAFAKKLASLADVYVNDAFSTSHRAHASMVGVTEFLPGYIGLLVQKELENLNIENAKKPFMAIIGGAKLKTKIGVIQNLVDRVDKIFLGGAMIFTFYKAKGFEIGKSLCDENEIDLARNLLEKYKDKIVLPLDVVVAESFSNDSPKKTVSFDDIPKNSMGLDIGKRSISMFTQMLKLAKTVVWNGPMGAFEMSNFAKGTFEIAKCLADIDGVTIVGGGDSVAAINMQDLASKFTHISTAGGASLEFLAGKNLPALDALIESNLNAQEESNNPYGL